MTNALQGLDDERGSIIIDAKKEIVCQRLRVDYKTWLKEE